jgi:hypothetical protein
MTTKKCNICNEELPITQFEINKSRCKEYYRNKCKQCRLKELHIQRKDKAERQKLEITHKVCNTCSVNLEVSKYNKKSLSPDGFDKICRDCYKITRHKKKQEVNITDMILYCIKCKINKNCTEFPTNARSLSGYYNTCSSCWKPREWNKEKQKESERKYVKNNPDKVREKMKRRSKLPQVRIKSRIQNRIRCALKSHKLNKNNKTSEYIGCSIQYLKKWLEFQFTENINWDNMNIWHIDHVLPCSNFDLTKEDEQKICFNWQNLRPCLANENMEKNNKIIQPLIDSHKILVSKFLEINPLPTHHGNIDEG